MHKVPIDLLVERLQAFDHTEVCDLLQISVEDLLRAFKNRIVLYQEKISSELDLDIEQAFDTSEEGVFDDSYEEDFLEIKDENDVNL